MEEPRLPDAETTLGGRGTGWPEGRKWTAEVIEYALYGAYYLQWSDTIRHTTTNLYFILRGLLLPEYTIFSNSSISYSYGHVTYQLFYYT